MDLFTFVGDLAEGEAVRLGAPHAVNAVVGQYTVHHPPRMTIEEARAAAIEILQKRIAEARP